MSELLKLIDYTLDDARKIMARMTALRAHVAAAGIEAPELPVCPECGPVKLPRETTVAEHLANVHGIPP